MTRDTYVRVLQGFACLVLLAAGLACGKPAPKAKTETAAVASPSATPEKPSFRPEVLYGDERTAQMTVTLPVSRTHLDEARSYVISVIVVAECGNTAAQREVARKKTEMSAAAANVLGSKSLAVAQSTAGKMKIREEILARLQAMMENKAIKQIYFKEYYVGPGSQ